MTASGHFRGRHWAVSRGRRHPRIVISGRELQGRLPNANHAPLRHRPDCSALAHSSPSAVPVNRVGHCTLSRRLTDIATIDGTPSAAKVDVFENSQSRCRTVLNVMVTDDASRQTGCSAAPSDDKPPSSEMSSGSASRQRRRRASAISPFTEQSSRARHRLRSSALTKGETLGTRSAYPRRRSLPILPPQSPHERMDKCPILSV